MSKVIIGICSKTGPQSGKDTVAAIFLECFRKTRMASSKVSDYSFEIKRFSDIIKHNVSKLTGCSILDLESGFFKDDMYWDPATSCIDTCNPYENDCIIINNVESYKKLFIPNGGIKTLIKIRVLLQLEGDKLKSLYGDKVFINNVINNFNLNSNSVIVPDVRFIKEVNVIKAIPNSILICVNRGKVVKKGHSSDTGLKDFEGFDYIIDNNESLKELENKVIDIFFEVFTKLTKNNK